MKQNFTDFFWFYYIFLILNIALNIIVAILQVAKVEHIILTTLQGMLMFIFIILSIIAVFNFIKAEYPGITLVAPIWMSMMTVFIIIAGITFAIQEIITDTVSSSSASSIINLIFSIALFIVPIILTIIIFRKYKMRDFLFDILIRKTLLIVAIALGFSLLMFLFEVLTETVQSVLSIIIVAYMILMVILFVKIIKFDNGKKVISKKKK